MHPKSRQIFERYLSQLRSVQVELFDGQLWAGTKTGLCGACACGYVGKMATPANLNKGTHGCPRCGQRHRHQVLAASNAEKARQAECEYREAAFSAGVQIADGQKYINRATGLYGTCAAGHYVRLAAPGNVRPGRGRWCVKCGPILGGAQKRIKSCAQYLDNAKKNGITLDPFVYTDDTEGVYGICSNSHAIKMITGHHAKLGYSMCPGCSHHAYDKYYIVSSAGLCKPGVTGNMSRIRQHYSYGLIEAIVWSGLSRRQASDGEQQILRWLKETGERPIRGKEYFHASLYPLILSYAIQVFGEPDLI